MAKIDVELFNKKFNLSEAQIKKYLKWQKGLPKLPDNHWGAVGGGYSFIFVPTGIGTIVKARREDEEKNEIDLTEYEYF